MEMSATEAGVPSQCRGFLGKGNRPPTEDFLLRIQDLVLPPPCALASAPTPLRAPAASLEQSKVTGILSYKHTCRQ